MSVVIQSATIDDAEAIAEVQVSSLRAAYEGLLPDHLAHLVLDPPDVKRVRSWKKWIERTQVSTVVACVDGTVTGFCTLHPARYQGEQGMTGEVEAIYVLSSHWRRGIGRLLFERILAEARTRGFAEVVEWVLEPNERARRFYDSMGFRPDGTTRVFLESSDALLHELRYRRNTSPATA